MYEGFKKLLANTPEFNLISLLLAVIGLLSGFFFYLRSRKHREPMYVIRNVNVMKGVVGGLDAVRVQYKGQEIENVSIARIAIWNRGTETINQDDIAVADLLRVQANNGAKILEAKILFEKQPANRFWVSHNESILSFEFDYFDKDEGVIVQILHTGKSEDLAVLGTIKGAGGVKKLADPFFVRIAGPMNMLSKLSRRRRKLFLGSMMLVAPFIFVAALFVPQDVRPRNRSIVQYISAFIVVLMYWSMAFSLLKKRLPRGFELFEEEILS